MSGISISDTTLTVVYVFLLLFRFFPQKFISVLTKLIVSTLPVHPFVPLSKNVYILHDKASSYVDLTIFLLSLYFSCWKCHTQKKCKVTSALIVFFNWISSSFRFLLLVSFTSLFSYSVTSHDLRRAERTRASLRKRRSLCLKMKTKRKFGCYSSIRKVRRQPES